MYANHIVLTTLADDQRKAIKLHGTPLPVIDGANGRTFILLSVQLSGLPDGSVCATIPGLGLQGEGSEPEEAIYALVELTRALEEQ